MERLKNARKMSTIEKKNELQRMIVKKKQDPMS